MRTKKVIPSNLFMKDYKKSVKRWKNLEKLKNIIDILAEWKVLARQHRPHKLSGKFEWLWECHIEPDWLLIYDFGDDFLDLARLGTHSDLFK